MFPQCDVHDLDSAANAEDGIPRRRADVEEIDFELVTIRIDAIRCGVDVIISVPHWIDVRPSAQREGRQ